MPPCLWLFASSMNKKKCGLFLFYSFRIIFLPRKNNNNLHWTLKSAYIGEWEKMDT